VSGRLHSRAVVENDLRRLRAAGITNLNLDLIAGLAGQTLASWEQSLDVLLAAAPPHASVYMLEVDEDSRLGRELIGGGARYGAGLVPTDDAIAAMYEAGCERLERAGLRQYEISNFARRGAESRHNLRYWRREPYLGVGLDAHSMLRARDGGVVRFGNTDDLTGYLVGGVEGVIERVDRAAELEESWFLGLRMVEGVSLAELRREFGDEAIAAFDSVIRDLIADGLLARENERIALTMRGRMLSNEVFGRFLGVASGTISTEQGELLLPTR
jgi:oxygen-independent coproporphyrinogen-3 oxidase